MPILNGHEVRHRAAELAPAGPDTTGVTDGEARYAQRHFAWLAKRSGIPVGTIHNATRDHNPQGMSLSRIYDLAAHLCREGEDVRDVVTAIVAKEEDVPEDDDDTAPATERPRDPSAPPGRKNGKDDRRGPRRNEMRAAS